MKVYDMAPPINTRSTRFKRLLMNPILSETLAPPRTPMNGRLGDDSNCPKMSNSLATNRPTTRGLPIIACGRATIDASLR